MATVLIHNGVAAGAMGALVSGRYISGALAADYATMATAAHEIADAVATQAATVSLADADLASPKMEDLCSAITMGVLLGRDVLAGSSSPPVEANYSAIGLRIAAAVKAGIASIAP